MDKVKGINCKALNCGGLELDDCSNYPCPNPYDDLKTIPKLRVCSTCGGSVNKRNTTFYNCSNCGLRLKRETELRNMSK